jgi:hypothetical protein
MQKVKLTSRISNENENISQLLKNCTKFGMLIFSRFYPGLTVETQTQCLKISLTGTSSLRCPSNVELALLPGPSSRSARRLPGRASVSLFSWAVSTSGKWATCRPWQVSSILPTWTCAWLCTVLTMHVFPFLSPALTRFARESETQCLGISHTGSSFQMLLILSEIVRDVATCLDEWPVFTAPTEESLRAAAHQLRQDKHQDMRQKKQPCFIRDSDSSPHTEVARICVLSQLLVFSFYVGVRADLYETSLCSLCIRPVYITRARLTHYARE